MVYVVTFVIASLFFWAASEERKNKKCITASILDTCGIVLLATLAGLRVREIGVDVNVYVVDSFARVCRYSTIYDIIRYHTLELGYELIEFLISRITNDFHWMLFVTAFIILLGIHRFAKYFEEYSSLPMTLFAFMCIYYGDSYNLMRQTIAISIYLGWGAKFLVERKPLKYFAVCGVALLLHYSAVVTIPIYFIYVFLFNGGLNWRRVAFLLGTFIAAVIFFDYLSLKLIEIGILPMKYLHYFSVVEGSSSIYMQVAARLPLVLGGTFFYKPLYRNDKRSSAIYIFLIMDMCIMSLATRLGFAIRISLYLGFWQCFYISELFVVIKRMVTRNGRPIIGLVFIIILLSYWTYYYMIRGFSRIYPYSSDILPWL